MTILVTGATGTMGSRVTAELVARGASVRALVRDPGKASLPPGVEVARGDLLDVDSVRAALAGARTLFLLNAVAPDELTQALLTLALAREAGIARVVYLSVIHADLYTDVPHFTGKLAVERMIEDTGLPATILRPAYFMQNDLMLGAALREHGVYPMPVGGVGLAMVDVRDIAEAAAIELLRRDASDAPLPTRRINLVGPDLLTGDAIAAIWSDALDRPVAYGGDDAAAFEQGMRNFAPGWMALDMRLMLQRFQSVGMRPGPGDADGLAALLGRPLRRYRDFAAEAASQWRARTEEAA